MRSWGDRRIRRIVGVVTRADGSLLEDIEQRHGAMREAMDEYRLKFPLDEVSKDGSIDVPIGSQNRLHVSMQKVCKFSASSQFHDLNIFSL